MQFKVLFGRKSHGHLDFQREKKKTKKSCLFLRYFLCLHPLLSADYRKRVRASDSKQRRRISLEETHGNFIAAVRK